MKKLSLFLIVFAFLLAVANISGAATDTATVNAGASVLGESVLFASAFEVDPHILSDGTDAEGDDTWTQKKTALEFGTLTHNLKTVDAFSGNPEQAGLLYAEKYNAVLLVAFTNGTAYNITLTCPGLGSLGDKGLAVSVDARPKDKKDAAGGQKPINRNDDGSELLPDSDVNIPYDANSTDAAKKKGSAVGTDKLIYYSGAAGKSRTIAVYLSIPPYNADSSKPFPTYNRIPVETPVGSLTTTVTFKVVAA